MAEGEDRGDAGGVYPLPPPEGTPAEETPAGGEKDGDEVPGPPEGLGQGPGALDGGASDQEIAKALGCAKSAVCLWRRKSGLRSNVRPGGWNKKQYDWELARKLYDEGQSTARIAEALHCSKNAVYDWMDGEGLVRPSRQKGEENGPA